MKKDVLSWFGHVELINDERMAKKIYEGRFTEKWAVWKGDTSVDLQKHSIKDTEGKSRKSMRNHRRANEGLTTVDEAKDVMQRLSDYPAFFYF